MSTNQQQLQKLADALQKLVEQSPKGSQYVKGGMFGVEQTANIIKALDVYVRTYLDLNYEDIDTIISDVEVLNEVAGVVNTIYGLTFTDDLFLKGADDLKKYTYLGESASTVVYLPNSIDLILEERSQWQVTIANLSPEEVDIKIKPEGGNVIEGALEYDLLYGMEIVIEWGGGDEFFVTSAQYITTDEVSTKTSDYTTNVNDVVLADASSGIVTITLGAPWKNGKNTIKKIDNTLNKVIIDGNGSNIDGDATFELLYEDEVVTLVSDGDNWYIT